MSVFPLRLLRTEATHPDFQALMRLLDAELRTLDGDEHSFYAQFNKADALRHTVVAYAADGQPAGIGALRTYADAPHTVEVKRMYVPEPLRAQGIATAVLRALESWAGELGFSRCILETGLRQPDAVRLYEKNGYTRIANYPPYVNMENSVCFEKWL